MTEPTLQQIIVFLDYCAAGAERAQNMHVHMLYASIADRLRAMQWRPVTDTEPAYGQLVLGSWEGELLRPEVMSRSSDGVTWREPYDVGEYQHPPTHWMPLPPPPKGGQ